MEPSVRYQKALEFARDKHKNQYRIGGAEYISHPVGVAEIVRNQGYDEDYQIAALFHDLLEDTDATEEEVLSYGNELILEAVKAVTKSKGYVMEEYVAGIKKNKMAFVVKAADRLHNLQSAKATDNEFKRKYAVETIHWYLDFHVDIACELEELIESMEESWKKRMRFVWALKKNPKVLMEGALGERLKREFGLIFDEKIAMAGFVYQEEGQKALTQLWKEYASIAEKYHVPFLATTPTRRLNHDRVQGITYPDGIVIDNIALLKRVQKECECEMYAGALIGSKGNAYTGDERLSVYESIEFHEWEIERFARAGVDFFYAALLPNIEEAIGIAKAIEYTKIPYIISFTIQEDGCLIDGTSIHAAIERIDAAVKLKPAFYMTNCVHPTIVKKALEKPFNQTKTVQNRFLGIQANTSPLSYTELDNSPILRSSEPDEFAIAMKGLDEVHPMKLIGGCCGTDWRHMEAMAKLLLKVEV